MSLWEKLFGKKEETEGNPTNSGSKYENWKGPWLFYNGEKYPLDIPGVSANPSAKVEIDLRGGSMKLSVRGGGASNCKMSMIGNVGYITASA